MLPQGTNRPPRIQSPHRNELRGPGHERPRAAQAWGAPPAPRVRLGAIRAITEGKHGYTPSAGIPELRQAVADHFSKTRGVQVEPDEVVCACGGKLLIGYAILSVTDYGKGDEVVYPKPGLPIY